MGTNEHKKHALTNIGFAVVTVSDSRTKATDTSGSLINEFIEGAGHRIERYTIVQDDMEEIQGEGKRLLADDRVDAIIFTGGTGISERDITPESIRPLLEKELPGFGELFRNLSMKEIGSAAMMSRVTAGTARKKAVFCIPGSRGAVSLAMKELILEEAGHILWEVRK